MHWLSHFYFAALILLFACGESPRNKSSQSGRTNGFDRVGDSIEGTQHQQQLVEAASASRPVMGGSADVRINFKEPVSGTFYLVCVFGNQNLKVDSAQVTNNSIRFQNEEGYPQGVYYAVLSEEQFVQFILGADQEFTMTTSLTNSQGNTTFSGSQENSLFYASQEYDLKYEAKVKPLNVVLTNNDEDSEAYKEARIQLDQQISEREAYLNILFEEHPNLLFSKFKKAGQNPKVRQDLAGQARVTAYRNEFWDQVDFTDTRLMYTSVIQNKLEQYFTKLTIQHPDSVISSADFLLTKVLDRPIFYKFIANWIALKYEPTKIALMDAEAVFVHMVQNYFTYDRAYWSDSASTYSLQLRAYEMSKSLVGQIGPNVTANDPNGQPQSIYDMNAAYLIVYLFNPTCEHCLVETPKLVKLYNQHKRDELIDVYSIAIETEVGEWKDYLQKNGVSFTSVFDPTNQSIYAKYYVDITPEIYVLNRDRTIIAKNIKVDQIMEVIERDLAKN